MTARHCKKGGSVRGKVGRREIREDVHDSEGREDVHDSEGREDVWRREMNNEAGNEGRLRRGKEGKEGFILEEG